MSKFKSYACDFPEIKISDAPHILHGVLYTELSSLPNNPIRKFSVLTNEKSFYYFIVCCLIGLYASDNFFIEAFCAENEIKMLQCV